jgi:hypothetical protein
MSFFLSFLYLVLLGFELKALLDRYFTTWAIYQPFIEFFQKKAFKVFSIIFLRKMFTIYHFSQLLFFQYT